MPTKTLDRLAARKCLPSAGGTQPLSVAAARKYLSGLRGWHLKGDKKSIGKEFLMKDFVAAVRLIDLIKDKAQADNHHPDLHLTGFRHLKVELSTHEVGGLSDNDFILAAQIEKLPKKLKRA